MMMGSHSLKTICWYSATLILLASCKNKIRTRDKNTSCRPGRRSRRSTWGSSSSARWPACCALSWRGCAARSGSAARSRGSRQQRNNPKDIYFCWDLIRFAICYWRSNWLFTFFPLPQTSQPVTFPEGSLAQDGNDPCRPRWLVSCQENAGWKNMQGC